MSQSFPNLLLSPSRSRTTAQSGPSRTDDTNARPISAARPSVVFPETMRRSAILEPEDNTTKVPGRIPSLARFPTTLGVAETLHASPSDSKGKGKGKGKSPSKVSRAGRGWPSTGFGLEQDGSSPTANPISSPTPSITPTTKRKARDSVTRSGDGQSKLASFGFFSDKPAKPVRGFDQEWDQEEDLADLEEEDPHGPLSGDSSGQRRGEDERGWGGVPAAPPHPDLRPAGLRELKRRGDEQERQNDRTRTRDLMLRGGDEDEEREQPLWPEASTSPQPGISTDDQSSLTTDDDMGMNGSVAAWYEGLEDRRSSEFGSLSDL